MKSLAPETKVGLLTIACAIGLLYLSLKASGISIGGGDFPHFYLKFNSVAGVELRSKVNLSGVEIGYIDRIILEDGAAVILVKLTREAKIRKDATATIRTSGLLGEKYIEIIQGTGDQPFIQAGETLVKTREAADISDMMNKMGEALDDVKAVTSSLKGAFGTLEGQQSLKNILTNIDSASANMKTLLAQNKDALNSTIENFSLISKEFSQSAPQMASDLSQIASGLKEIIEKNKDSLTYGLANLKDATAEFRDVLSENRENLRITLENIAAASSKVDGVLESVKTMTASLENVSGKIERGEGTLGKLVTDEQVYVNLNKTLDGAGKFLNKADDVTLYLGFRGDYAFEHERAKSYISLKLKPREDKYYLFEVSEDMRREGDLTTTRNTLNSLLYTVMIAKRLSDITLRAGVIDSSAGVGIDYFLLDDKVVTSMDVFNLEGYDSNASEPQIKVELKWQIHKYGFLYAGGDELLNEYYRSFYLGAGVLFDENDLKMALGFL